MDYKYIEQLLERYWQCETSLEEESILQTFFAQKEVPTEFLKYKGLFSLPMEEKQENFLGADFDKKVLAAIEEEGSHVKVKAIRVSTRKVDAAIQVGCRRGHNPLAWWCRSVPVRQEWQY